MARIQSSRLMAVCAALLFCAETRAQLLPEDLAACDAPRVDVASRVVRVNGQQQVDLQWNGAPSTIAALLVREQGIDVSVSLAPDGAAADSPVRRRGTQVLLIAAGSRPILALRGKEPAWVNGSVAVSLIALPKSSACLELLQLLARGDREYTAAEPPLPGKAAADGYDRAAGYRRAAEAYSQAEALAARSRWAPLAAHAQLALASVQYQGIQDWVASRDAALRARDSLAALRRDYLAARAAAMAGAAMLETGTSNSSGGAGSETYAQARALLEQAAAGFNALHERYDEALQRNNVGLSYLYAADFPTCVRETTRAISAFTELGEHHRVALARQNVALCEWGQGDVRTASKTLDLVLPALRDDPLPIHYTTALNNAALTAFALGAFDRSILLHAEGEREAQKFAMPREQAQSLYGLGVTFAAIGDFASAEDYLRRSLQLRTAAIDGRGRVASLRALASVLDARGTTDAAEVLDREALGLTTSLVARLRIESRLIERNVKARRIPPELRKRLDVLVAGEPGGDVLSRARALYLRGVVNGIAGNTAQAFADLSTAQSTFRDMENIDGEYDACLAAARLAHQQRDFARARTSIECATRLADQMRAQVLSPELRANVSQLRRDAADLLVQIIADDPRDPAQRAARTLVAMERHRSRLLADYAAVNVAANAGLVQLHRMYDDLASGRAELARLQARGSADRPQVADLRRRVAAQRIAVFDAEQRLRGGGHTGDLGDAPAPLALERLPADTAAVEYWLGPSRAFAMTVTRDGANLRELATTRSIEALVTQLRDALLDASGRGPARRRDLMRQLSAMIIEPLALEPGIRQLVFVPDGLLHYVPLPGLCVHADDCTQSLVETYIVSTAPSVSVITARPPRPAHAPTRVLVVADPVYEADDPRVTNISTAPVPAATGFAGPQISRLRSGTRVGALRRLPGTAIEAESVAAAFAPGSVEVLTGPRATRGNVLSLDLGRYDVLHFAVHGLSDDEMPRLSALALSRFTHNGVEEDGRLWAGDLLQRRLSARIVFLSACDTALGPQFAGEGLVGLKYVLLSRGARNVIASLWPVEDVMTSELVADVYQRISKGGSVAAALSWAQRTYLASHADHDILQWAAWSTAINQLESGDNN